jgi:hypothetical protein
MVELMKRKKCYKFWIIDFGDLIQNGNKKNWSLFNKNFFASRNTSNNLNLIFNFIEKTERKNPIHLDA